MSVEVTGLTKIYGSQKAIDNISFKVNKGEIVGFLGPNGAGKSTTIKIITGYLRADEGKAYINDFYVAILEEIGRALKLPFDPRNCTLLCIFDAYSSCYCRRFVGACIPALHKAKISKCYRGTAETGTGFRLRWCHWTRYWL